jgi:hypothetical protein
VIVCCQCEYKRCLKNSNETQNDEMTLCKPAITGESNKIIGLAIEAEVRRVHDITDQDYDLFEVTTHKDYGFPHHHSCE